MTALHMEILLHYYSIVGDYALIESNSTRLDYAYQLAKLGLLYSPNDKSQRFRITTHGIKTVENILSSFGEQQ